jgi:hypothetical protein
MRNVKHYDSPATPDQQIAVVTKGSCAFESFKNGGSRNAHKDPVNAR